MRRAIGLRRRLGLGPGLLGLALLLSVAGCRTPRTIGGDEGKPPGAALGDASVDREALAHAIDPGPQPRLSENVPEFLLDAIGLPRPMPQDPDVLVQLAGSELQAWKELAKAGDLAETLDVLMGLSRAVVFAERAVQLGARDTETLRVLERAYDALDAPMIANDRALFPQLMQLFVQSSAAQGHITDSAAVKTLSDLVFGTVARAGPAHRHTVAELLRSGDDPVVVADALERVAPKVRSEDDALGIRLMRASLSLRGDAAEPRHYVELAHVCHAALDLACGAEAIERARAAAKATELDAKAREKLDASLVRAREDAERATTVIALRGAKGRADRLKQARALLDLSRHADAKSAYDRLRADFPRDAGPVAGLARHAIVSAFDLVGASSIIEQAGEVENADLEYYEIAIGCRATALIYDILPRAAAGRSFDEAYASLEPVVLHLRDQMIAYEALGADKGVVLHFLADLAIDEVIPLARAGGFEGTLPLLRGLLPRTLAVLERAPGGVHANLLVDGAVQFSADREAAFAALDRKLPEDPKGIVAMRHAIARYELIVTWDAAEELDPLLAEVQALRDRFDTSVARTLEGDTLALVARLRNDESAWPKAEAAYRAAIGDPAHSHDVRALNNLAVAIAEQGRAVEAQELWARAVATGGEHTAIPTINLAVTRRDESDLGDLAAQSTGAEMLDARMLAMAWEVELAPPRARAAKREALAASIAEETPKHLRPRLLPGRAAIALQGTLNFGLGYSSVEGLQLDISTASQPWLAIRPPGGAGVGAELKTSR